MPLVEFTPNLARQTHAPSCRVEGTTVAEALEAVFALHPALRSYILDDQNAMRTHVIAFINGTAITDRRRMSDAVKPESEIFVMQALSGG
jgi:molybdopterin synthase sulfur carrier subunit